MDGQSPVNQIGFPGGKNVAEISKDAADKVWKECLGLISQNINTQSLKTWFEPVIPISLEAGKLILRVPSQFFYDWLEEHYSPIISGALVHVLGNSAGVEYSVQEEDPESSTLSSSPKKFLSEESPAEQVTSGTIVPLPAPLQSKFTTTQRASIETFLNPRYTFENFIKGDSNQFARAAALAVANNPGGTSFNPLLIYGGVGLGKTHLMQAIGDHVLHHGKAKRVMDDIQFFSGKEKTQDNFFHTFNALHQLGKQIVLSCDKPPKELKGLDERLISRFQWGLIADIQPPDLETRIAILRKKSMDDGIELRQDVIELLVSNVTSNIRELEGCLITLLARASLENKEIDVDLAKDVVRSVIGEVRTHVTIEEIQRTVCEYLNIPEDLIRAKTRKQEIVNARQIAMYLCKELTNCSLKTIGLHFGGRDHSTVIHAYQTVEDLSKTDPKYRSVVQQLRSKIDMRSPLR